MGIVLSPNTDLDALQKDVDTLKTPVQESTGMSPKELYDLSAERQKAVEDRNKMLEDYDASFLRSSFGSFRFNTAFGSYGENIIDSIKAGPEDPAFDLKDNLKSTANVLPWLQQNEYEYLKKAKNKKHFNLLVQNLKDKRDFELNNQALGVPAALAAGLFAELGNPVNYVPFLQFAGLNKVRTVKQAFGAGALQGALNVAEEVAIDTQYKDRGITDYVMAYTFGHGLGMGTSLLTKARTKAEFDAVQDTVERVNHVVTKNTEDSIKYKEEIRTKGEPSVREDAMSDEDVIVHMMKEDPEYYESVVYVDDDGKVVLDDYVPSTEDHLNTAVDIAEAEGRINQEKKLPQEYIGLGSMAQSLSRSKNKYTRYMNNALLEHGEKSGFKEHTAALDADLMTDRVFAGYSKNKIVLHAAWSKEAEKVGYKPNDFNRAAMLWLDGGVDKELPRSTKEMNSVLDEFTELYRKTNAEINRIARESGVEEFQGIDALDDMHLYRSYDLEKFHTLTSKYGSSEPILATLREAIRRGNIKEFSARVADGEDVDIDSIIDKMAQAIYNRMLKRATVNTADANLLSSGNQRLLRDALKDVDMSDADRKHITYILDTAGRDLKANPQAKQIKMDLSTKVGDVAMSDLMHTNLDHSFMQKGRYWLGRAALARKGKHFASERAIQESIDVMDRFSTKAGQTPEEVLADKARLQAGIRMILGQPVDPSEMGNGWQKVLRSVRKAVGASGLGKLGLIQYSEGGRAIAAKGVSHAMAIPELAKLSKSIVTGNLDSYVLKEIEDFAVGQLDARIYMQHPDFRLDDYGYKISEQEKMLDKMSYFMSKASGWNRVHHMQTAYVMDGLAQKWYREIMSDTFKKSQMDSLGITGLDVQAIKAELKKHSVPAEGLSEHSKVRELGLSKWEPTVRRKFGMMLQRKAKNAIQDIMAGETPLWMNTTIGKFLGQFRSFSVAALSKQTTGDFRLLSQGDLEGALALEFMIATSTLAILAKTGYKTLGMSTKERKKFLDRELSPAQLTANVMAYVGSTSALIDLGTVVSTNLFGVNLAGQRMYKADGISGLTPGIQYIDRFVRGASGVFSAPFTGLDKTDMKALMSTAPLNTLWGVDLLTKFSLDTIPE